MSPWSPALRLKPRPPCAHVLPFPAGTGAAVRRAQPEDARSGGSSPALARSRGNRQGQGLGQRPPERVLRGKARELRCEGTAVSNLPEGLVLPGHSEGAGQEAGGGRRGGGWMADGAAPEATSRGLRAGLRSRPARPAHSKAAEAEAGRPHLPGLGPRPPPPHGAAPGSVEERPACGPSMRPPLSEEGSGWARAPAAPLARPPSTGHLTRGCRARAPLAALLDSFHDEICM